MTKKKSEAGQVLILAVLSLVVLMGLLGLGIDVGYLQHMRTKMQQAADAAALAGASELNYGDMTAAADNDAASNGFTNGSNGTTITVNNPPVYGGYTGNSNYVEVIIQQPQPTFFMSVLGFTQVNVAARAVAYSEANAKNCLIALGVGVDASLGININANVDLLCGVADNSTLSIAGNLTAPLIGAVEGLLGGGSASTNPITGIPPLSDPLAYLTPPAVGGCSFNNTVVAGSGNTLSPGVYCGGITISAGANVTFLPGLYVINGGSFQVGAGATVVGTQGETFYITGNATVSMDAPSIVQLVAPTSAPTPGIPAGILFYQDPSDTEAAIIDGGANGTLTGTLYFPSAPLTINGTNITDAYTIIVADSVTLNASIQINANYPNGQSPIKTAVLVE